MQRSKQKTNEESQVIQIEKTTDKVEAKSVPKDKNEKGKYKNKIKII
jgi:hypothetical protein